MSRLVRLLVCLSSFASLLAYASSASASTISMVWISASGGNGVGTSTLIGVSVGETAVLEIRVTVQAATAAAGIEAIGVTFNHDLSVITAVANQPCPATPNNPFGPGNCGALATAIGGIAGVLGPIDTPTNQLGSWPDAATGAVVAAPLRNGQANGAFFELAHLTFSAVGVGMTGGILFRPVDGQLDIGGAFSIPSGSGATISVIPEPGTFALLALGLGALGAAGHRR